MKRFVVVRLSDLPVVAVSIVAILGVGVLSPDSAQGHAVKRAVRHQQAVPYGGKPALGVAWTRVVAQKDGEASSLVLERTIGHHTDKLFGPFQVDGTGRDDVSLDGRWFAYCDKSFRVHIVDLGSRVQRIIGKGAAVSFSHDSRYLAFSRGWLEPGQVHYSTYIYGTHTRAIYRVPRYWSVFSWAHRSDRLAGTTPSGEIAIVSAGAPHHGISVRVPYDVTLSVLSWAWHDAGLLFWRVGFRDHVMESDMSNGRTWSTAALPRATYLPSYSTAAAGATVTEYRVSKLPVLFTSIKHGWHRGITLPGLRYATSDTFTVAPAGTKVLVSWRGWDGMRWSQGTALWRPGDPRAHEIVPGCEAFWVRLPHGNSAFREPASLRHRAFPHKDFAASTVRKSSEAPLTSFHGVSRSKTLWKLRLRATSAARHRLV